MANGSNGIGINTSMYPGLPQQAQAAISPSQLQALALAAKGGNQAAIQALMQLEQAGALDAYKTPAAGTPATAPSTQSVPADFYMPGTAPQAGQNTPALLDPSAGDPVTNDGTDGPAADAKATSQGASGFDHGLAMLGAYHSYQAVKGVDFANRVNRWSQAFKPAAAAVEGAATAAAGGGGLLSKLPGAAKIASFFDGKVGASSMLLNEQMDNAIASGVSGAAEAAASGSGLFGKLAQGIGSLLGSAGATKTGGFLGGLFGKILGKTGILGKIPILGSVINGFMDIKKAFSTLFDPSKSFWSKLASVVAVAGDAIGILPVPGVSQLVGTGIAMAAGEVRDHF